jgi:hypothetical protein
MPNSNGCVHAWPESIQAIAELLAAEGIKPVPNTNGKIPYPYKPRGLLSVELVDPPFPKTAVIPRPYTLFKQCDAPWGPEIINTKTVCAVGCLMSSISMAINTNGIAIPAASPGGAAVTATPGSLNTWLRANHGYDGSDDLEETAVPAISPAHIFWNGTNSSHRTPDLTMKQVRGMLRQHQPVIANVLKGRHFVLVVGWDSEDGETLYINDSGFMRQTYNFSDVVGWRLFQMLPASRSDPQ